MTDRERGPAVVVQPGEGDSFWQPVPANGYAEVQVSKRNVAVGDRFASGVQVIAPMSHIREHLHDVNEEILFFFEGTGQVLVNGEAHPVVPGTVAYVGPGNRHKIVNDTDQDLKMMWVLMPGGLEDFFQAIGRPREAGQPAPEPFPRPDDVERIERETVFGSVAGDD